MKKSFVLLLAMVMLLSACSGSADGQENESGRVLSEAQGGESTEKDEARNDETEPEVQNEEDLTDNGTSSGNEAVSTIHGVENRKETDSESGELESIPTAEVPLDSQYIIIEGIEYSFPVSYDELLENGWTFDPKEWPEGSEEIMHSIPAGKRTAVYTGVLINGEKKTRQITFINESDDTADYTDCEIRYSLNGVRPDPEKGESLAALC